MRAFDLQKPGLLNNKKFLRALLLAGIHVERENRILVMVTNQEINLRRWFKKWRKTLSRSRK